MVGYHRDDGLRKGRKRKDYVDIILHIVNILHRIGTPTFPDDHGTNNRKTIYCLRSRAQEEKERISDASQLIVHAATSCCCWGFTFVTVVLAVNAIAGADYSAFVIFIPQFVIAGTLLCCMVCFICCVRDLPDMGEPCA